MRGQRLQYRLLQRLWRNIVDEATGEVTVVDTEPDEDTLRALHKAIDGVSQDMAGMRFNTAIAKVTELNNHLTKVGGPVSRPVAESLVLLVAPLAPHIAEELWRRLGLDPAALGGAVAVTPSCGLAGASPAYARAALAHCVRAARTLVDNPE